MTPERAVVAVGDRVFVTEELRPRVPGGTPSSP